MLFRFVAGFALTSSAFALSNAVVLTDQSGAAQNDRTFTIARYFADKEICRYPAPYSSGSALPFWQADVKTRWPADAACSGGYARFALISFEISLAANGNKTVEFRNSESACSSGSTSACAAAGLSKDQMLAFSAGGAGPWGAGIAVTASGANITCAAGSTIPCGARAMLSNNHYQVLEQGPVRTSVLIREGPSSISGAATRTTSIGLKCTDPTDGNKPCLPPYSTFAWKRADNTLTNIVVSANVATANVSLTPGLVRDGYAITVSGSTDSALNGSYTVGGHANPTTPSFTFPTSAGNGSHAETGLQIAVTARPSWSDVCPNTAGPTGCYRSIRPSYVATFYPRWGRVEIDFVLENAWMDRMQDQMFDTLVLFNDSTESGKACYTAPAKFVFPAKTRIVQTCWSTAPGKTRIDFNRAYMTYSKVVPAYGMDLQMSAATIASQIADFQATGSGFSGNNLVYVSNGAAIVTTQSSPERGRGQWGRLAGAGGGGGTELAVLPMTYAQHLISQNSDLYDQVLQNALAWGSSIWFLEPNSSAVFYQPGGSTKAFGRPLSLHVQTGLLTTAPYGNVLTPAGNPPTSSCVTADCIVAGTSNQSGDDNAWYTLRLSGANRWQNFAQDRAHANGPYFYPYLISGKYIYLEALQQHATWLMFSGGPTQVSGGTSRGGVMGFLTGTGNDLRAWAWPLRNLADAALMSWDGTAEKTYFTNKTNNNIALVEGRLHLLNGAFPPSNSSCIGYNFATETDPWRFGWCDPYYGGQHPDPLNLLSQREAAPCDAGVNPNDSSSCKSPWMAMYYQSVLGYIRDHGFTQIAKIQEGMSKYTLHHIADSTNIWGPVEAMGIYRQNSARADGSFEQSWASLASKWLHSTVLAAAINPTSTSVKLAGTMGLSAQSTGDINMSGKNGAYLRIGSEIMWLPSSVSSTNIYSKTCPVDKVNNILNCGSHGLADGEAVQVQGYPYDSGISGSVGCIYDKCTPVYVKRSSIDPVNKLELYSNAALSNRITLTGSSTTNPTIFQSAFTVERGGFGPPMSHAAGEAASHIGLRLADIDASDPIGAHGPYFTTGLSYAVDYDVSTIDEGTGKVITAQRAYEAANNALYYQDRWSANPMWGIRPRPRIRNVRIFPAPTSVTLVYDAPDGNACRIGVSPAPFASTDDSGDAADGRSTLARSHTVNGLASGTAYNYRITCGPAGGAARVAGTFTTR